MTNNQPIPQPDRDTADNVIIEEPSIVEHTITQNKEQNNYQKYIEFTRFYQEEMVKRFGNLAPKITESLIKSGADTLDMAIGLDGFSFEEIVNALRWAYNDNFWKDKVMSLANIRHRSQAHGQTKLQNLVSNYKKSLCKTNKRTLDIFDENNITDSMKNVVQEVINEERNSSRQYKTGSNIFM